MEYFHRHPGGVNPVLLNDVVFSTNAAFAQGLLILQCFFLKVSCIVIDRVSIMAFFQRGMQKLSYAGIVVISLMWLVMLVTLFISIGGIIDWLDYLYVISYIKLAVTPIKYIPQVN